MIITVSISDFRQNISEYLEKVSSGHTIILKDEKRDEELAEVTAKKKFDSESFGQTLNRIGQVFTAKNHPEWRTKRQVIAWVEKERRKFDRTF